jgi:hypothetical protein
MLVVGWAESRQNYMLCGEEPVGLVELDPPYALW